MRRVRRLVTLQLWAAALAAAAAAGTTYLDEGFDEGTLPAGWRVRAEGNGMGYYTFKARGGDYYYYAAVLVNGGEYGRYAEIELISPGVTVPTGALYFFFDFASYYYGTGAEVVKSFAVRHVGSSINICHRELPAHSGWRAEAGSFWVTESKPIQAFWLLRVFALPGEYGIGSLSLDNAKIADEPNVGVAPASLGRVKGLFR